MANYIILFSPTGGTRQVADILAAELFDSRTLLDLCDPAFAGTSLTAEDLVLFAVPSYGGRVPCTATERMKLLRGNGARAILLCVYGNRAYDNTLAEMKDQAQTLGFRPVAALAALAEHSMVRRVAAGRPDAADAAALKEMAVRLRAKLASGDLSPCQVPGRVPDKPIGNFGGRLAPAATGGCTRCGLCAAECPTLAIDSGTLEADKEICIGCMRCICLCPADARKLPVVLDSLGGVALQVLCSQRKENELFL